MIYKVDFEGQTCKQIKEKAESYQYDLKSVLKGIGLLIADMWLPGDSKPQINTWEGLFEKVQEDYSYKDTIVENDFICSISNDDGISIIIEIADETIVDFKDIKSSILQVRDFLLANKWSGAIPDFLPIEQKEIRNMMNETERSIPFKCLHEAFFECAYRFPDKTALEWLSLDEKWETLSYEALKIKVLQTASMLKQEGVHTRDKVAIVLPKGENQIIAVLAILSIGATYVPIGIHQPLDRKKKIFEAGNISYALTDRDHINTLDGADTLRSFLIENSFRYVVMPETEIVKDIDSIAYIIFTSGTTGIPKGVMITHKAAYNTIYDVNDKFTINEHDCAIAVSELDFDLSVYDIFGMLGYGASLIVLNEMNKREPYIWKKILCEKRVTIWNSVPALFEMFLLAIGYDYEKVTLKNILLSGDWIKLEIYPKVNKLWPECRFVSLGGATEAAIWSVYYEVHILDEPWTSIPYGRPLANQLLRVVNNKGKDSPVGVPGELWIGGYGVAEGYVNEEKLTQERFVKIDGIRWYKTGDKAQYFQDGNVQFLGRLDDQVKVNGYRIELGEIENVIKRAECIDDAIAMTVETNGKKEIVAAVVEKYEKGNASHQVFMNEENPEYAEIQEIRKKVVAAFILKVYGNNVDSLTPNDNIVINSNGKVEQYWNVWLLINNVISHKDSDEYVLNLEIKNVLSDIWYMKLETQIPMVQELIRGTVSASNLLTNGYLSPEELLVQGSDTVIFLEHVTKVIKHDSKVAVLGARTGLAVEMLLNNNLDRNVELTLIDESAGMLKRAEERLRRYDVQFEYYHFEDGLLEKSLLGQFDFVIALGELHRYKNPLHGLHVANMLLKAKGQLLALEYEELDPMSIISSAILENGFSEYMRKRKNTALMTVDEWLTAFEESAFDDVMIKVYPTSSALFINANANKYKEYLKELEEYVRNSLVQYMLPQEFITFTWFPLSQNGKVDRKKIRQIVGNRKRTMVKNTDYVGVEREIAELWKEMLSVEDIGRNDNFFEIGGDSLLATQFVECLKQKYEIEMSLRELAKRRGVFGKALLPVVFTCVLFDCPENYFERLGSIKYAVSQTPQVFLDNQITEMGGRLHISWDVVDELFEACIIDEIFLEFVEDIKRISENNKANSTNDFVTKVWGNILTKEIITKSVVPDLLKNIDLKQIKILDYAQELCPPDVKGQVYVSESEIMNDRNKTYYKILEHPLYGRMADTGIIGVLTHDGYMEFVVPNCETSVETPDKKEDTHEEEIEKPIVKEIMKIWKEVFEIEDISIQDDFYTLGGDSIILMRLVDEMCKTLGCDVTVDDILQSENISDLANRV